MPTCPICKKEAAALPITGDADGYDCQSDGQFKVAGTLKALPTYAEASTADWQKALQKARSRTKPGDCPTILADDLTVRSFSVGGLLPPLRQNPLLLGAHLYPLLLNGYFN
jgi:hypothetical protein